MKNNYKVLIGKLRHLRYCVNKELNFKYMTLLGIYGIGKDIQRMWSYIYEFYDNDYITSKQYKHFVVWVRNYESEVMAKITSIGPEHYSFKFN